MAWFFSLTLIISIVGLVMLLMVKHYEMTTGRVVLGGLRPKIGHYFHRALMFFERGIPGALYRLFSRGGHTLRTVFQRLLARAIVLFEYYLEHLLHIVRQQSQAPRGEGVASQFLQEVAAHKQKLLRKSPRKRMIYDDQ